MILGITFVELAITIGVLLLCGVLAGFLAGLLGVGKIGGSAMDAIARQPEATGQIQTNMILTSAFVEGVALFAVVACAFLIK